MVVAALAEADFARLGQIDGCEPADSSGSVGKICYTKLSNVYLMARGVGRWRFRLWCSCAR